MKFKFNNIAEEDDKLKKEEFDKKWKWTRYIIGTYTFDLKNKKNNKINSKFLSVFCFLAITLFICSMIFSVTYISYGAYHKLTTPQDLTIKGMGLIIPSWNYDTLNETLNDSLSLSNGVPVENNRRDFVFIPINIILPILLIICLIHEFGHYIACRKFGIKVDSFGFGAVCIFCIPILPFGYVNPNNEELDKCKKYDYLAIIRSGAFMNILGMILFIFLVIIFPNKFTAYLLLINFGVIIFNCLPFGSLDGGLFMRKINKIVSYISSIIIFILLAIIII
jgi:Zn-dependent protease